MKKNLLFALALTTFGANAQQKLIGLASREYDETGSLTYNDSIDYTYNSWEGSLTSNEPEFAFNSPVFDYLYKLPTATWNAENVYGGTPLQFGYTRQNTFLNGNLSDSEIAQNDRQVYTYDASGNLTKIEYFFWNVSQFDIFGENNFEYDANNNLTVENYISDPTGNPNVETLDSLFYDASNNLIRAISYQWDGAVLAPESESLITYTGNEVDNLQLYESGTSQLEWVYDIYYNYASGAPSFLEAYPVTGGIPDSVTEIEIYYTYNSDNQLELYEGFLLGDLFTQQDYSYDAAGFVENIETSEFDFASSSLYVSRVQDFYYQSTADVNELPTITAAVFPNPSNDFISIDADAQIDRVTVLSMEGKVMISQKGNNIDVSNLTSGVYLVNVMTSEGSAQTRFVKN